MTASLTATESSIAVKPATASILKVTGFPTSDTAGAAGNVVVTAYDAYGNVATGYTGTVSLTSSDPHAVLPSSFTFPGTTGTHTFAVTLETAGRSRSRRPTRRHRASRAPRPGSRCRRPRPRP